AEAFGRTIVPAVLRTSPVLSVRSEGVRWSAGRLGHAARFVYTEQLPVAPHVRAVMGGEQRQIPEDMDARRVGVSLELPPGSEEAMLRPSLRIHGIAQFISGSGDRIRVAIAQFRGPSIPRSVISPA